MPDRTKFPPEYHEGNLLANIVAVISDRTSEAPTKVAWLIAEKYGGGDYGVAEDRIWDRVGQLIDDVQDWLGLEWAD